jgi:glycosyltransferase involved in cell wall biosynthesis
MILVVHPFGNANVRAVLAAFEEAGLLAKFWTTIGWSRDGATSRLLPKSVRSKLARRAYDLPPNKIKLRPARELARLLASPSSALREHERGWASVDAVLRDLDDFAAREFASSEAEQIGAVYAYEDCAEHLFVAARERGARRVYDLPIAYWETSQRLLREEAERWPRWEPTLGGTRDSAEKLERKTRELELAELVLCPSAFVLDSLPAEVKATKQCIVTPFGSPVVEAVKSPKARDGRLRVLFAGAMTQRKGLADLFAAIKLVDSAEIELVVMGSALQPLSWYREEFAGFTYESPRPHADVLRLMQSCDVFVLPSIVEGRALVQQEAMACGLPVIATRNAGADDLIGDGETGFLVPIRSPEAIAEKISWCADHRESISGMGIAAQERARELTWRSYGQTVLAAVRKLTAQ